MLGKEKCKYLREIRKKIALENDIRLVTDECTYKGECKGTCPKCEAEVRYLENELERKKKIGKIITIAGLSLAGLTSGTLLASCEEEEGDVEVRTDEKEQERDSLLFHIINKLNQNDIVADPIALDTFEYKYANSFSFVVTEQREIKDIKFPVDNVPYSEEISNLLMNIFQNDMDKSDKLSEDWNIHMGFRIEDNKLVFYNEGTI
ncbi:MAG: hypothetical protein IK131_06925 [Paludibacteraceae bacterium]|nr:hypothetical protein [Paludibacteraceae bacterium]